MFGEMKGYLVDKGIQTVLVVIQSRGVSIEEMEHQRADTLCCGEGGAVGFIAPELAGCWGDKIKSETRGKQILTYFAGCVSYMNRLTPTNHVLDFFYEPEATLAGKVKGSKALITYWNRIRLKKQFQNTVPAMVTRERGCRAEKKFRPAAPRRFNLKALIRGKSLL
jgi:hypothetical protein